MRLLHTTHLTFEEFFESEIPSYAILSHRWISGQEISYEDFLLEKRLEATGWGKIRWFASVARDVYHLEWCWVDTCCIDKKSSAELSEAINSMYKWYEKSAICVAFVSDVDTSNGNLLGLEQSQWFKRGWTLQELLAPRNVAFYQGNCNFIGTKETLGEDLARVSGIPAHFVDGSQSFGRASVAQRMSWASERKTTRVEDVAYCLLGIFDVNMPLLYGEGEKAFARLQSEIINQSDDESIFAWTLDTSSWPRNVYVRNASMLADSPKCFANSGNIQQLGFDYRPPYTMTKKGLDIQVYSPMDLLVPTESVTAQKYALVVLRCCWEQPLGHVVDQIYILMFHVWREIWARVALPYHIRGWRQQPRQVESVRVQGSLHKDWFVLYDVGDAKDTGAMDIGSDNDLSLIDFGLEAKAERFKALMQGRRF